MVRMRPISSSRCGVKGAIFSLDAALMIVVGVILLSAAASLVSDVRDPLSTRQLLRAGYDVVSALQEQRVLDSLDNGTLSNATLNITPVSLYVLVNVSGSFGNIANNLPVNTSGVVVAGSVPVTIYNASTNNHSFGMARFSVWPR